jgi:hypothetical protein
VLFVGQRGDLGVSARDGSLAEICGATARPLRGEEDGRRGMTGGPVASEAGRRARVRARWADLRRPSGPRALVRADRSAG